MTPMPSPIQDQSHQTIATNRTTKRQQKTDKPLN